MTFRNPDDPIVLQQISELVRKHYGYDSKSLVSRTRTDRLATTRHIIWWLARKYTNLTLEELGTHFKRDHGSVLHGVRRMDAYRTVSPGMERLLGGFCDQIETIVNREHVATTG